MSTELENADVELPIGSDEVIEDTSGDIEVTSEATDEVPDYVPNYKFNVLDEQKEVDDWIKDKITDADMEAKVRDLYERAYGVEHLKGDRNTLREHNQKLDQTLNTYSQNYQRLGAYVQNKDYGSFLKEWNISPEEMVDFAINHVRMNDPNIPAEERQAVQQQTQQQRMIADLQYQNQMMQSQLQGNTVQQTAIDLNMELSKPEIASIAQDYDSRAGKQGAFRERVINMGSMLSQPDPATGQYRVPTVSQVLDQTIQFLGYNPAAMGPQPLVQQPGPGAHAHQQQAAKPVIPTVRGSGASPVKAQVRSFEGLRKLAQQMNG